MSKFKENNDNIKSYDCKVVLIGDMGVGKTCIIKSFVSNKYNPNEMSSGGASLSTKELQINKNTNIKFLLWDTVGQEKFKSITKLFYKDVKAVCLVCDITSQKSFESLKKYWYNEVIDNCGEDIVMAVCLNKFDLYEKGSVNPDSVRDFANIIGAIYKKTTVLDNKTIIELFTELSEKYINFKSDKKKSQNKESTPFVILDKDNSMFLLDDDSKSSIKLENTDNKKQNKCC